MKPLHERPGTFGDPRFLHDLQPVVKDQDGMIVSDIVGNICESGDFLVKDRGVPICRQGDLMAFMIAGAYSFAMSSSCNIRHRVAEVMVTGNMFEVTRER